jgi:hypothetical protein
LTGAILKSQVQQTRWVFQFSHSIPPTPIDSFGLVQKDATLATLHSVMRRHGIVLIMAGRGSGLILTFGRVAGQRLIRSQTRMT